MGTGTQTPGLSFTAFTSHLQRIGSEMKQPEFEPLPVWDVNTVGNTLTCYAAVPTTTILLVI